MNKTISALFTGLSSSTRLAVAVGLSWPLTVVAQATDTPASTPAGIMLVEVHREEGFSSDPYFWTRLGDADGSTLFYISDERGTVTDDFKPVLAHTSAQAFGDWALVTHPDSDGMQWS